MNESGIGRVILGFLLLVGALFFLYVANNSAYFGIEFSVISGIILVPIFGVTFALSVAGGK